MTYLAALESGELINGSVTSETNIGQFDNLIDQGTRYVGVEFDISGNTHYGFLQFQFNSTNFNEGFLVAAARETNVGNEIFTTPIPEASNYALLSIAY